MNASMAEWLTRVSASAAALTVLDATDLQPHLLCPATASTSKLILPCSELLLLAACAFKLFSASCMYWSCRQQHSKASTAEVQVHIDQQI
jgi:hypothetical protein